MRPKKAGVQREMNNMRVRKLSLEMLGWGRYIILIITIIVMIMTI